MKACKYCGKWIDWERNANGKSIPVNPDGTPHHRTCKAYHKAKALQRRRDMEARVVYGITRAVVLPDENPNQLLLPF